MLVKIEDIKVKKRVRKDLGDLDSLKDSLRTYGLLNPITLTKDNELVAGERRLEAAKAIGWEKINAIILGTDVDAVRKLEIELEENNQRKEFSEEELLEGYHRLERLKNPSFFTKFLNSLKKIAKSFLDFLKGLFKSKPKQKEKKPVKIEKN